MIPQGQQSTEGGYERKDADVVGVILVLGLVLLIIAISYLTVQGLLLLIRTDRHYAAAALQRPVGEKGQFPQPRLQVNPVADFIESREASETALRTYGWVDRSAGVVRIPIERAMQILMERGLPEVGGGQTRLQLMQARPSTDLHPNNPVGSPGGEASPPPTSSP